MKNTRILLNTLLLGLGVATTAAQAVTCQYGLSASNPDSSYTINRDTNGVDNGTVTHTPTGLTWKRCMEGQTWTGTTCTGASTKLAWAGALAQASKSSFANQTDWRLPNRKELLSLVEACRTGASINNTIFPSATTDYVWTGSPSSYSSGSSTNIWLVEFNLGATSENPASVGGVAVRLVRSGVPIVLPTVAPTCTVSASPASVALGDSAALTATCNMAPTSYAWAGACVGTVGDTCKVTPMGTTSYSVAGVNAVGTGATASTNVSVTGVGTAVIQPTADGRVIDTSTGLVWKRCMEGQTWSGTTCTGNAAQYTYTQASALKVSFAGQSDWRVPTVRELQSIVDYSASMPAISSTTFPNAVAPDGITWSSSVILGYSSKNWLVGFNYGTLENDFNSGTLNYHGVRLVRGGLSTGLLDMTRPSTDYVDAGDGTVTHTPTGLIWQRCMAGQVWSAGVCMGSPRTYTWDQAIALTSNFAGKADWRVPSVAELVSLVDYTNTPPLNSSIFPASSQVSAWSSTLASAPNSAPWLLSNNIPSRGVRSSLYGVRFVRGGIAAPVCTVAATPSTSSTSVALTASCTPAATSYVWTGACAGTNGATCTITPTASTTYSVAGVNASGTGAVATSVASFTLPAVTGAAQGNSVMSDVFTVFGLSTTTAPISITNGEYQINGGAWMLVSGTVKNGDVVRIRVAASPTLGAVIRALLAIGSSSSEFVVTTSATPVQGITIPPVSGVPQGNYVVSDFITILGLTSAGAPISIVNGEYQINGGAWTLLSGSVKNGDVVRVRLASSSTLGAVVKALLNVGSTSSSFSVTTTASTILDDGTVTDPNTGLVWMRCLVGQTWANGTCAGTISTYSFDQANALTGKVTYAGRSDWRIPNIRELLGIADYGTFNPALNANVFPNDNSSKVWSSTPSANDATAGWFVGFNDGLSYNASRNTANGVRMVRAGQALGLLDMTRPTTDYVDNGDGTVTHKPTGLAWQRCMVGQTWTGSTCTGTATTHTWDQAKAIASNFAGKTDWRVPSQSELLSIADYAKTGAGATLNTSIFPNDPASYVWSSSLYAGDASAAWGVYFSYGHPNNYGLRSNSLAVRLVRGNMSLLPLPSTDINCFLGWAEARLPTVLTPAKGATMPLDATISYRSYSGGVYVGIEGSSNAVLAIGGAFGNSLLNVGQLGDFLPTARTMSCQ